MRKDGQIDMKEITGDFHDLAKTPKENRQKHLINH